MFCQNCSAAVSENAQFCTACGVVRGAGRGSCGHCGKGPDPIADFCTGCGASLAARPAPSGAPFAFGVQAPGNAIPPELTRRWSWGAFLLSSLWPFWNANTNLRWLTIAAIVFGWLLGGIPSLALGIYLGVNGNRIAARDRRFASTAEFAAVQSAWARAGVIVVIVGVVFTIAVSVIGIFANSASKATA